MKARHSFLKAITNKYIKKITPDPFSVLDGQEVMPKIQERIHQSLEIKRCFTAMSSSFEVSFNLDKLYFDDDEPRQEAKNQIQEVEMKKEQNPEITSKNCLNEKEQQQNSINLTQQLYEALDFKDEPDPPSKSQIDTKLQIPEKGVASLEPIKGEESINEELQKTITIDHSKFPTEQKFKDMQIQVDFPDEQQNCYLDSDTAFSPFYVYPNLSQIDMLFVNPQSTNNYSAQNPLLVTIQELARVYPLDLDLYDFVRLHPSQQQQKEKDLFEAFMQDWKKSVKRSNKKKLTLAKMRTVIVRDAMNALVDTLAPPNSNEDYHLRISKTYRQRYIKAGIPIPPPRVNNSYLQNIFSKPHIKQFYSKYLTERLEIFLQEENFRRMEIYTLEIMKCLYLAKTKTVEQLIDLLDKKKKPFTNKEIQFIINQAHQITQDYGNCKKRIGNGQTRKVKKETYFERFSHEKMGIISSRPQKKVKIDQNPQQQEIKEEHISFAEVEQKGLAQKHEEQDQDLDAKRLDQKFEQQKQHEKK